MVIMRLIRKSIRTQTVYRKTLVQAYTGLGGLLLMTLFAFWPTPVAAHDVVGPSATDAQLMMGLVADEEFCGPYGYRLEGTDLCSHGTDRPPTGANGTPLLPTENVAVPSIVCTSSSVNDHRVQVLYVRAEDQPDRYDTLVSIAQTVAAGVDKIFEDSAQQTDGYRRVRFVTTPDCEIDVINLTVPAIADDNFTETVQALRELGYDENNRKYLVFMDADIYCGIATIRGDITPGDENVNNHNAGYGRIDRQCWNPTAAAHELAHTLGAIQMDAPNASGGWHCTDSNDVMCYSDAPHYPVMSLRCIENQFRRLLDCNNDDYFHTNPPADSYLATHWNVANSLFLIASEDIPPGSGFLLEIDNEEHEVVVNEEFHVSLEVVPVPDGDKIYDYVDYVDYQLKDGPHIGTATEFPYEIVWQAPDSRVYTMIATIHLVGGGTITRSSITFAAEEAALENRTLYLPLIIN